MYVNRSCAVPLIREQKSMQFLKDRFGGGCPAERLTFLVVVGDEVVDSLHELFDAREGITANGLVGDQREEAFDLVQPASCRSE